MTCRHASGQYLNFFSTEPVDTISTGRALLRTGFVAKECYKSPVDENEGNLFQVPTLGLRIGLCSRVEMQIFGPLYQRFDRGEEEASSAVGPFSLATKIRLFEPRAARPGLAFRWGVKLPNVSERTGIDSDEIDFFSELNFGLERKRFSLWGSVGLRILGNPRSMQSQDDLFSYGIAGRVPVFGFDIVSEIAGAAGPGGRDWALVRLGMTRQLTHHLVIDAAVSKGVAGDLTPSWEFASGFTLDLGKILRLY
ncbi:hypothetical protein ACFLU6_06325 [Acidobacteriota bacterium]